MALSIACCYFVVVFGFGFVEYALNAAKLVELSSAHLNTAYTSV